MWVYYVLGAMFCYGAAKTVYQKFVQKGIVSEEEFILSKWYRKQQKRLKRLRSSSLFPLKIMDHSQETTLPQSIHSRSMSLDRKPDTFKGPPMVIIPGLMGSRLSCKGMKVDPVSSLCQTMFDQWTNLWVSIESVFPSFLGGNCWESNIKPLYDMNKNEWVNSPQLTVEADDFGTTKTFDTLITFFGIKKWSIFYFQKFTDYLRYQYNYKDGQNLFGAGYDFRVNLSPSYRQAYHKRLKLLIERAFNQNSNQKVWLVTHSMGCPTAQVFLCNAVDSAWKSKYIAGFIPIAGPFGGSPKAFQAILSGVDMVVMSPEKVKSIAQSMSGTAWMLPNPQIFALPNSVVCSEHKFSYRTKDMESMFSSAGLPNSYLAGIKTHVFRTQQSFFKAPNVNTYPVCGSCVQSLVGDTSDDDNDGIEDEEGNGMPCGFVYKHGLNGQETDQPNHIMNETAYYQYMRNTPSLKTNIVNKVDLPTEQMVGDGTVPFLSMMVPQYYWRQNQPIVYKWFVGGGQYGHSTILDQPEVVDYIMDVMLTATS